MIICKADHLRPRHSSEEKTKPEHDGVEWLNEARRFLPTLKNGFIDFDDPIYVMENMRYLLFQLNSRYIHQLGALCGGHMNRHRLVGVTEIQRSVVAQ